MKRKIIAAACMALGTSASFAVTLACDTTSSVTFVNTCAPEATLFIAGSSALGGALSTVVPADLFDPSSTIPLVSIKDTSTATNGNPAATSGWYGMSLAGATGGTSKRLYVVYNNNNGSAAGVSTLLVKAGGGFEESKVVNVGPVSGAANTCALTGTSATVVGCTTIVPRQADLAISDVNPLELYAVYAGVKLGTPAKPTTVATPLAMQGFGVAVNPNLYNKLQAQQIASGEIPASASCATGDYTLACQPSIKSAQYSALVSKDGSIKTAAALVGDTADTSVLTLARRDDLSGTQAASNIFFARNACGGIGYDATSKSFNRLDGATKDSKVNFAALGGGLDIISSTDSTANLVVQANATSSGVKTALQSTSGYAIGVLGLGSNSGYKFVKIDGQSPNFKLDGTADSKFRSNMINGRYPFQVASFAAQLPKPAGVLKTLPGLATAVINGLKDSTLHDLTAIGYLDGGSNAAKASLVTRINGNNCSPLVWK